MNFRKKLVEALEEAGLPGDTLLGAVLSDLETEADWNFLQEDASPEYEMGGVFDGTLLLDDLLDKGYSIADINDAVQKITSENLRLPTHVSEQYEWAEHPIVEEIVIKEIAPEDESVELGWSGSVLRVVVRGSGQLTSDAIEQHFD